MVQAVMGAMGAADEASLPRPPLTSCCAAQVFTAADQGLGIPDLVYEQETVTLESQNIFLCIVLDDSRQTRS